MANQWTSFSNLPSPADGFSPDTMLLLTDGSVLVHHAGGREWFRLTPDVHGKYEAGTWSAALPMANTRQFFASGVLRDGRVYAIGGEDSDAGDDTPLGEIFDPLTNTWSRLNKPASFDWIQGDAVSCILPDGRVLLGAILSPRTATWDPTDDDWRESGLAFGASAQTKVGRTNEETWTLLPDGTVLTVQIFNAQGGSGSPAAEKYVPELDQWISAGTTPAALTLDSLVDPSTGNTVDISEIGPAVVLPDGRLFAIGGTGHTALYTPPASPSQPGSWAAGPDLPADTSADDFNAANGSIQTAIDAPACLLPGGRVLLVVGQTVREVDDKGKVSFWSNPCAVCVYDPSTNAAPVQLDPQPPSNNVDGWQGRLLVLPTGQVLLTTQQAGMMAILTVDASLGVPAAAWKPVVTDSPQTMVRGQTYVISGRQLNGLSQACSYGDDAQYATNYPIVQLTHTVTGEVVYLRSFDFSTLGIATGNTIVSASVQVPAGAPTGPYSLVAIANGIASDPLAVTLAG